MIILSKDNRDCGPRGDVIQADRAEAQRALQLPCLRGD